MKKNIELHSYNDIEQVLIMNAEGIEGKCPRCHMVVAPDIIYGFYKEEMETFEDGVSGYPNYVEYPTDINVVCICPNCGKNYSVFGEYDITTSTFFVDDKAPKVFKGTKFNKEIERISERFIKIYREAETADYYNLKEISGIGYRKAFEFLVKDYIIDSFSEAEDEVKDLSVGRCITKYIDNQRLKNIAQRCAWIGNDETHYKKKHADLSVDDLKDFIGVMLHFIEDEITYKRAMKIEDKNRKK